jgi:hypothetical protein
VNPVAPAAADVIKETKPTDIRGGGAYHQSAGVEGKAGQFRKRKWAQNRASFFIMPKVVYRAKRRKI